MQDRRARNWEIFQIMKNMKMRKYSLFFRRELYDHFALLPEMVNKQYYYFWNWKASQHIVTKTDPVKYSQKQIDSKDDPRVAELVVLWIMFTLEVWSIEADWHLYGHRTFSMPWSLDVKQTAGVINLMPQSHLPDFVSKFFVR